MSPTRVSRGATGRGAQGRLWFKPHRPEGKPALEATGSRNVLLLLLVRLEVLQLTPPH